MSENKNLYVLTLIDYATRWVEAIPLRDITSQAVSEALLTIFARVGLPEEILSDGGPQFVSQVMELVLQTLGIKHSCLHLTILRRMDCVKELMVL